MSLCSALWFQHYKGTFNLKGGVCFFFQKNILIPNVAEKNILILVEEKKII
jgi:hypothetical protein